MTWNISAVMRWNNSSDVDVPALDTIIPPESTAAYDMLDVVYCIVDEREFLK